METVYLSICIPSNGRIQIVKNTLDSIFINCKASFSDFEVILSDNSSNDELPKLLENYAEYPNIIYAKTSEEGFLNSLNALKLGQGLLLKLHNNNSAFTNDGLEELIKFIKSEHINKPLIYFKNNGKDGIKSFNNFDLFTAELSFWNTWSSGFSIWKMDFDKISNCKVNNMFPQVSLFFLQNSKKSFIINDNVYFYNQDILKKGGYDLFKTFAVDYLRIVEDEMHKGNLTQKTFEKIKKDLFLDFLVYWYAVTKMIKNDYTFELKNIKKSICVYYSISSYYELLIRSFLSSIKIRLLILKRHLKDKL